MNALSRHVIQSTIDSRPVLFNTVTRTALSLDTTEDILQKYYFLAGQEEQALRFVYSKRLPACAISIVATWQCNLRCSHCMVNHKLVSKEDHDLDVTGIVDFVQRYTTKHGITDVYIHFIGGEGLLVVDRCLQLIDSLSRLNINILFYTVTNLTIALTDKHLEFFNKLERFSVSIDGLEEYHNKQRLPLSDRGNAFRLVLSNLKKLVLAGLKDKITIQACVDDDFTIEDMRQYYETMLQFGTFRVLISHVLPTIRQPVPQESYLESLRTPKLTTQRCCKYRLGSLVVDFDGNVLSDYYSESKLGTIYDDVDVIDHQQMAVNEHAAAFTDNKCKECPVIGYCWGGCSLIENTGKVYSEFCDQSALIELVKQEATSGNLIAKRVQNGDDLHI